MAKRPTIADVARVAGTHGSTASRVLNRDDFGTPDLRARVLASAAELGYRPNRRAQSLRRARSWTIGLLISDLGNAAFLPFLRGAQHRADDRGYALLVGDGQRSRAVETRVLERFFDQGVDGLVIAGPFRAVEAARLFTEHAIPVAPVLRRGNRSWREQRLAQERAATTAAVERLAALGHRSIVVVSARVDEPVAGIDVRRARRDAINRTAERHGIAVRELPVRAERVADDAAGGLEQVLASRPRPTTIVASSHAVTPGVLRAIRMLDLAIPRDVSFVTFGDSEWAVTHTPALSVVRGNLYGEASFLVNTVLAAVEGEPPPAIDGSLDTEFVERASTGPAPLS